MQRLQQTAHALGSEAFITLVLADTVQPQAIFATLWQKITDFERRFSRFLPDSELSQCNQAAGARHPISPQFRALLIAAKNMSQETNGLYNPFVLPALQQAGYKGSWPHPETMTRELSYDQRRSVATKDLHLGDSWVEIPRHSALDMGGIGKGYLLDELAAWLAAQNIEHYWLSLGGDIRCAGFDSSGESWRIAIQHATQDDQQVAHVVNNGASLAIATSGITKRKGHTPNGAWHHLIDPRTNKPAETDILTATVCDPSATRADVLAKCLVIMSSNQADQFIQKQRIQNALLQIQTTDLPRTVKIKTIGTVWSA